MGLARFVLGVTGAAFALYGVGCLLNPGMVADYSGMNLPNANSIVEVVAMYGGLQLGLGVLFLFFAADRLPIRLGLIVLVVLLGSLALGRTFGMLVEGVSTYNLGALIYESATTLFGFLALRRFSDPEPS